MRKQKLIISISLMLLLLLPGLFAAGQEETEKPMELYIAGFGVGKEVPYYEYLMAPFIEEYPEVVLIDVPISVKDATSVSMDMRIAAGLPVHFYGDYFSRAGKYVIPKNKGGKIWALDLSKYWDKEEVADFLPGTLDPYWIDGQLLGTPHPTMLVGMQVNLTILEKSGYVLPPNDEWTLDEYYTALRKTKAADLPGVWPTAMFAMNQSGDWHYMGYFSTFGTTIFENNDYTKTTVNSPAGLETFKLWKQLQDEELIPHEAAVMADFDMINMRVTGKLAVAGSRFGIPIQYNLAAMESMLDQGIIDEPFETTTYNFPRALGIDKVPILTQWNLHVAFGSEDEAVNEVVARFAWHANNARAQIRCMNEGYQFPTRKSVVGIPVIEGIDFTWWTEAKQMLIDNGAMDVGGSLACYGDIRGALFPQLQKLFTGQVSPEEALELYEDALNKVVDDFNTE